MVLASAFRSLADESHSMTMLTRYESRLRRIHKQAHAMLLRLRQERVSEPAPPAPPPVPAPAPDLAPVNDAPEECAPPDPAPPPAAVTPDEVIPLTPKPEARCSPAPILLTPNPEAGCSPPSILSTPKPEARCSHENKIVGQADSLPVSHKKSWQNEPKGGTDDRLLSSVTRPHRRFRSRRARKIFNAARQQAARC